MQNKRMGTSEIYTVRGLLLEDHPGRGPPIRGLLPGIFPCIPVVGCMLQYSWLREGQLWLESFRPSTVPDTHTVPFAGSVHLLQTALQKIQLTSTQRFGGHMPQILRHVIVLLEGVNNFNFKMASLHYSRHLIRWLLGSCTCALYTALFLRREDTALHFTAWGSAIDFLMVYLRHQHLHCQIHRSTITLASKSIECMSLVYTTSIHYHNSLLQCLVPVL